MPNTNRYPGWPEEREAAWVAVRETWGIAHDDLPIGIRQVIGRLTAERDEALGRIDGPAIWCSCGDRIMPGAEGASCATCVAIDASTHQHLQERLDAALAVLADHDKVVRKDADPSSGCWEGSMNNWPNMTTTNQTTSDVSCAGVPAVRHRETPEEIIGRLCGDVARLERERDEARRIGESDRKAVVVLAKRLADYESAGQTVREDCAHEALAEAQVCGCGQRIAERIRTVKGRGFGTANVCPRCRGLMPCGCGYYPAAPSLPDAEGCGRERATGLRVRVARDATDGTEDGPEDYPEDVTRIVDAFCGNGYDIARKDADRLWRRFSNTVSAGWLRLDHYHGPDIVNSLRPWFTVDA